MRILHLADLHFRESAYAEAKASIDTCIAEHRRKPFDLIAIAGDTWDGPTQNSARARFADFVELIRSLADCAPVAMIYGTPSHDTEGSLEVFERIQAEHGVTILRPGKKYFINQSGAGEFIYDHQHHSGLGDVALLLGVPEPNKKWLLANQEATGKDSADLAVQNSMRALFLGLGGMRKQHADLPCLLLYHGQVRGAKTATGYSAESGIAVTRDDLAMVGADYYALGDIHEPQRIGDLPAYYPGSIYPINWGETHKAGANVVEIERNILELSPFEASMDKADGFKANVSRLDFPHSVLMKVSVAFGEKWNGNIAGKLVWLEVTVRKEDSGAVDVDDLLSKLMSDGALYGSRVTLNILPTETVRAAEITEKRSLRDKVKVWAENSSITVGESALIKADELEQEAAAGAAVSGAHIRINRLVLRGAIGIWKNQRKDEIVLDLDEYGPGVIALIGGNGMGKSTILENLHPWPQLLTRSGALKDHFRLKDSCRDLYFTDERTGVKYRAYITIRADIASGAAEYYLYRDNGGTWEPIDGINGRKEPYEQAINSLFGSMLLYLRTAFQTQRPTSSAPDLAETTKGERKELFAELSGIDYLDGYRATAKNRADLIDAELVRIRAAIDAAADVDETIERLQAEILRADDEAKWADHEAFEIAERGKALRSERDAVAGKVSALERRESRAAEICRSIWELSAEIDRARESIGTFRLTAAGRKAAADEVARIEALQAELDVLRAEKAKIDEVDRAAIVEHRKAVQAVETGRRDLQDKLDAARRAKAAAEREAAVLRAQLSKPIEDHCPTCAQLLPEEKRAHLQAERARIEVDARCRDAQAESQAEAERILVADLAAVEMPKPPEPTPFPGAARMEEIESDIAFSDIDGSRRKVQAADMADVRIADAEARIRDAEGKRSALEVEAAGIAAELATLPAAREELAAVETKYEAAQRDYQAARERLATAKAQGDAARRSLSDAEKRRAAREEARASMGHRDAELADWRILERACGPDGIQALELDALAPSIAAVANRLLAVQSPRYSVEFRTTRIAGKGGKTKQVETFEIYVLDSETGTEQEIGTLSGGESVWIKRAVYDAFAAIRAQNTGIRFLTVMQDETDGALDPEARMAYLRMMEAAHKESGRHQTLLITHSTELQAMVSQIIDVAELSGREEGRAAA